MNAPLKKPRAPFKKKEGPTEVDVAVGQRLRERRVMLGMSQDMVAKSTGLTFQQIQKYEQGINRVSASRLQQFCDILEVEPNYFFAKPANIDNQGRKTLSEDQDSFTPSPSASSDLAELIRIFTAIKDPESRKEFVKKAREIAGKLAK